MHGLVHHNSRSQKHVFRWPGCPISCPGQLIMRVMMSSTSLNSPSSPSRLANSIISSGTRVQLPARRISGRTLFLVPFVIFLHPWAPCQFADDLRQPTNNVFSFTSYPIPHFHSAGIQRLGMGAKIFPDVIFVYVGRFPQLGAGRWMSQRGLAFIDGSNYCFSRHDFRSVKGHPASRCPADFLILVAQALLCPVS